MFGPHQRALSGFQLGPAGEMPGQETWGGQDLYPHGTLPADLLRFSGGGSELLSWEPLFSGLVLSPQLSLPLTLVIDWIIGLHSLPLRVSVLFAWM